MNEPPDPGLSDATTDSVLDGRVRLRQPRRGHRAGTDAILLAAAARLEAGDRMVDVGAGVGTVGLALALRAPDLTGTLLDLDPGIAAFAEENCRLNGVEGRLGVAVADLFDPSSRRRAGLAEGMASLVVTNPPFFDGFEVRASQDPGKARAHVLARDARSHTLGDWFRAALSLLEPKGRFYAVHRPQALAELLLACEGRLGGVGVLPVHGKAAEPAIRILLSGVKGSRAPIRLCPSFVLHADEGAFTPLAQAIHRGEALLPM